MAEKHDENKISVPRSDGKKHDLTSLVTHNYTDLLRDNMKPTPKPEPSVEEDQDKRHISIRRSDGLSHDIIKVFKAFSDPRGDSLRLNPSKATQGSPSDTIKKSSFSKLSMRRLTPAAVGSSATTIPPLEPMHGFHPTSVRIVHMSDTHNFLNRGASKFNLTFLPTGDILIHTGNFTNNGEEDEYLQFDQWLGSVANIYHYRVVVVGNRDVRQLGNDWDAVRARLPHATHVLCHSEALILGMRIYGVPWHWGHEANYTLKSGAPDSQRFNDIPDYVNILVSHGPAYGRLDSVIVGDIVAPRTGKGHPLLKEEHWGSKDLADAIIHTKPALHLHGHVRGARGILAGFGNMPLTVNSAMCDRDAKVLYACPHVIRASHVFSSGAISPDPYPSVAHKFWEFSIDSLVE